jgi:hypothetical protein
LHLFIESASPIQYDIYKSQPKRKIIMGIKISVNHQAIADALIKSGDLHREDCGCGLEYEHDKAQELQELIDIALDVIEIYGEAGLRALVNQAERRADELDLKVRAAAAQAKAEAEKALGVAQMSEYDQLALMSAVGSVGGDLDAYDMAKALVARKVYTVPEIMRLSREQLRHLLS